MRISGGWFGWGLLCAAAGGCVSFHVKYLPDGVEQRIGAAPEVLASAEAIWRCEGGERFALLDGGKRLFIASQDYFLSNPEALEGGAVFSYARTSDGVNDQHGVSARFFVPADRGAALVAIYAANYITEIQGGSGQQIVGNWVYSWSYEKVVKDLMPVRADQCWRDQPGAPADAAAIYRGVQQHAGGPPAGAKHLVLSFCSVNGARTTFNDRADLTWKEIKGNAMLWGGGEDSALLPQDVWIDGAGKVFLLRPDGTGLELSHRTRFQDVDGWSYLRAGVPVFVTVANGRAGAYVFRVIPGPWPPDPPRLDAHVSPYALACTLQEVTP